MSVCGQTEEGSASEEMGAPMRELYEQKAVSKVVRVLTVLAYLLSVSLAAILLSVYYICVWKSPELPLENDTGELSARRADRYDFTHRIPPSAGLFGGSNITVSEFVTQPTTGDVTENFDINGTRSTESTSVIFAPDSSLPALYNTTDDFGVANDTGTVT